MADTEHTYKFDVKMICGGCSGAVTRALKRYQENNVGTVSSFDVSLEKQEVVVIGNAPYDDVLAAIKKTGKEVRSGEVVPPEVIPQGAIPQEAVSAEVVNN